MTAAATLTSPIGELLLISDGEALTGIHFDGRHGMAPTPGGEHDPLIVEAARQLRAYFAGERHSFALPLRPAGTEFQRRVWAVLETVPWGTTTTYGTIAARLGLPPGASRAVGAANGANPLPVVLPCHRVIGSDGSLTGYAGGLERKALLLRLEGVATEADQDALF